MNNTQAKSGLTDLIEKIREITVTEEYDMRFSPGAANEEITRFEQENNFSFPELVKEWLFFADGCHLFNTTVQLYGIAHEPCVEANPAGITGDYICIGVFNFGDPICVLDKSPKIYQYGETIIEYSDFKKFLEIVIDIGTGG